MSASLWGALQISLLLFFRPLAQNRRL